MGLRNPVEIQMQVLALCLLKQKLKKDKINIERISADKLARIGNKQTKLRKSVLINNVLKDVQKEKEKSLADLQGKHIFNQIAETVLKPKGSTTEQPNGQTNTEDMKTFGEDKLSLCDDIINEFLDISNQSSKDNKASPDVPKCPKLGRQKIQTSPYSYNSFLSEVGQVENNY